MVDEALLALLRCPETMQPLSVAPPGLLAQLEAVRAAGKLRDRAGNVCVGPIDAGLVRADQALFFPIRDGIPVMILAEAVALPATGG